MREASTVVTAPAIEPSRSPVLRPWVQLLIDDQLWRHAPSLVVAAAAHAAPERLPRLRAMLDRLVESDLTWSHPAEVPVAGYHEADDLPPLLALIELRHEHGVGSAGRRARERAVATRLRAAQARLVQRATRVIERSVQGRESE